ncbi:MAG: tRNA pseudouridine(38-40) synthase TruA [Deltaproteobacteria bacterium]|nr:tRNA pseudouridine(38-40) synthase TruA [Deltaproteobacteria bacterium]
MDPARNIKLVVEYDGTAYAGWQFQANAPSVQAELITAILTMTKEHPTLIVAGRTDAGVHAEAQVTNFRTHSRIEAPRFASGLNSLLPGDISIHESVEAPPSFDARHDSLSKRYRYRIYNTRHRAALEERRAWHIRAPLDLRDMRAAAALLVGEHDFNAFRSVECDALHAFRRMLSVDVSATPRPPAGSIVEIVFHANAYCRHMCRIIAGTLVEVGLAKRSVAAVAHALESRDRKDAGVTAPPCGLTLLEVFYP